MLALLYCKHIPARNDFLREEAILLDFKGSRVFDYSLKALI
jgi:hypothetical protein